jgi:23S rRNA pseudouridine2605 synthase
MPATPTSLRQGSGGPPKHPRRRKLGAARNERRRVVPLERALSKLGLASRSEARALIAAGRVSVDGRLITKPLQPIVPERAVISIDGVRQRSAGSITVLLHKPRGVVTTRSDPEGRPTVYSLLADLDTRVVPVGRLDLATSGLLLLTNDTRLADWLTDPKTAIPRVYLVAVRGRVTPEIAKRLILGLTIDGEHLSAVAAQIRKASSRETHLVVTLQEGKNREIRRLFDDLGHPVTRLRRVQFGGLTLGTLQPGKWRLVSASELDRIFPGRPKQRKSL